MINYSEEIILLFLPVAGLLIIIKVKEMVSLKATDL